MFYVGTLRLPQMLVLRHYNNDSPEDFISPARQKKKTVSLRDFDNLLIQTNLLRVFRSSDKVKTLILWCQDLALVTGLSTAKP